MEHIITFSYLFTYFASCHFKQLSVLNQIFFHNKCLLICAIKTSMRSQLYVCFYLSPKLSYCCFMTWISCPYVSIIVDICFFEKLFKYGWVYVTELLWCLVFLQSPFLHFKAVLISAYAKKYFFALTSGMTSRSVAQNSSVKMTYVRLSVYVENRWHNTSVISLLKSCSLLWK